MNKTRPRSRACRVRASSRIRRARGRSPGRPRRCVAMDDSRIDDDRDDAAHVDAHRTSRTHTQRSTRSVSSPHSHALNTAMIAQRASTTRTIATPTRATEARRARVVANAADRKMWCVRTRSADRGIGEEELRRGRTRGRRARATRRATRRCARDGVGRIRDTGYLIWRAARESGVGASGGRIGRAARE